jgi:hypothetical protein
VDAASRAEIENRAASGNTRAQLELASLLDKAGDLEGTRVWLERAAESGDPLSCTLLGEVLLSRTPYDVPRGVDLICRATAAGNARATHLAALLAAAGVREPQSWPKALELVSKAAQGGWHLAQDTIGVTSSKQPLGYNAIRARSSDPGLWQSLSQAIDLAPFFHAPPAQIIRMQPRIATVPGFLPSGICEWLIGRAKPSLINAEVYDAESGRLVVDPNRNNRAALFPLVLSDLILLLVRERIARAIGRPSGFMEQPAVLNYRPGEQYSPHYDFCDPNLPGPAKDAAENGQRVLTFLIYLNDDYSGGETDFPRLPWRFRGRKGDALFWWSVDAAGRPDQSTLHAGLPPQSGEKWLFSQWVRDRPEVLYR